MSDISQEDLEECLRAYRQEAWAPYLQELKGTALTQAEKELVAQACDWLDLESRFNPDLLALIVRLSSPSTPTDTPHPQP